MSSSFLLDYDVMDTISRLKPRTLLDIACGMGKWAYLLRSSPWLETPSSLTGIDIWLPYLKFVKHHRVYENIIRCDVRKLLFRNSQFDVVLACEILEHLSKKRWVLYAKGGRTSL